MTHDAVLLMAYGGPGSLDEVEAYYTDIRRGQPALARAPRGAPRALSRDRRGFAAVGDRGAPAGGPRSRARPSRPASRRLRRDAPHRPPDRDGRRGHGSRRRRAVRGHRPRTAALVERRRLPAGGRGRAGRGRPRSPERDLRRVLARRAWLHRRPGGCHAGGARPLRRAGDASGSCSPPTAFRRGSWPRATPTRPRSPRRLASWPAGSASRATNRPTRAPGRTGEPWLGPDLRDELRRLASEGVREVVVSPVGFVAEHLEVLYDIDIEAQAVAREIGIRLERARSMNDDPTFISAIADVATGALDAGTPEPAPAPKLAGAAR